MGERSVVHITNERQLCPFPGKAHTLATAANPTVAARRRMLISVDLFLSFLLLPSDPLSFFPFHSRMHVCFPIHLYMISAHRPRVHHTLYCSLVAASKPSPLFVCFRFRERRSKQFFNFDFYHYLLVFHSLSPRGVGLRVCAFRSRMDHRKLTPTSPCGTRSCQGRAPLHIARGRDGPKGHLPSWMEWCIRMACH